MKIQGAFSYYVRLYKTRVNLYVGQSDDYIQWFSRKFKCSGPSGHLATRGGECCIVQRFPFTDIVIWLPDMRFLTSDYAILAHECLHAAEQILSIVGVQVTHDPCSEVLAYLFDDIYGVLLKQLHRRYKTTSKKGVK